MYHIFNIGMSVLLRIELKNWVYSKSFTTWNYMLYIRKHPRIPFSWHLDVCKLLGRCDLLNYIFDNELFQLSRETSCLFTTSIWQATKTCMLPNALGVLEDMSHCSVLTLKMQDFFPKFAPTTTSESFVKLSINYDGKYKVKMTSITLSALFIYFLKSAWKNGRMKWIYFGNFL